MLELDEDDEDDDEEQAKIMPMFNVKQDLEANAFGNPTGKN